MSTSLHFKSEEPKANFYCWKFVWSLGVMLHACTTHMHTAIHFFFPGEQQHSVQKEKKTKNLR